MSRPTLALSLLSLVSSLSLSAQPIEIGGSVLRPGGQALRGAAVELVSLAGSDPSASPDLAPAAQGTSDAAGAFRLQAPEAGMWAVRVSARGFLPAEIDLIPLIEPTELPAVELDRAVPLAIQVEDAAGHPLAGARLRIDAQAPAGEGWHASPRRGSTPAGGRIELPCGAREAWRLRAIAPGFPEAAVEGSHASLVRVRLPVGRQCSIELRSEQDRPLAGVEVHSVAGWDLGATDAQGRLSLIAPLDRELDLRFAAADGRRGRGTLRRAGPSPAASERFFLPLPVRIAGRVIELTGRRALAGALVWPADEPAAFARTGRDGRYALGFPAGGELRVRAAASGYLPLAAPLAVLSGPPDRPGSSQRPGPTVALAPAAALDGTVLDEGGRAIAGAEITASRAAAAGELATGPRTRSDAGGAFHLGRLSPRETYSIRVVRRGFGPAALSVQAPRPLAARRGLRIVLSRGLTVRGQVVDGSGRPVPGAVAALAPSASAQEEFGNPHPEPPARASADPQGRFEIAGLNRGIFDLQVGARGFAAVSIRGIEIRPGADDLGTVTLPPGVSLEGIVVDPTDQPIAGAMVAAAPRKASPILLEDVAGGEVVTGADGRFSIADLRQGEAVVLRVQRPGYLPSPAVVTGLDVPAAEPVRVVLRRGSRALGRVLDETGDPLSGARVLLMAESAPNGPPEALAPLGNARSDAAGRFVIAGIEPGRARARITAPGFVPTERGGIEVPAGDDLDGLEFVLRRGAVVEGRVYTADGGPAAGALVQVVDGPRAAPLPPFATPAASAVADGDGSYRLEGVAEGSRFIAAAHAERPGAVGRLDVGPGANRLDLHLPAGYEVTGRVVDTAGQAIGGARIAISTPALTREAESHGDGAFRLSGLPDGSYLVTAEKEGFVPVGGAPEVQVAGAPVQGLELRLSRGGAIVGRIFGLGPEELSGIEIWAGGPAGSRPGRVNAAGEYRVENVPAGEWSVQAQAPGGGRQARGVVTLSPGQDQAVLDLEFGSGLALTGRLSRGGQPVAGAGITLRIPGTTASASGVTDLQGRFRIEGLAPGTYDILIPLPGEELYRERLDLTANQDLTIELPPARS